MTYAKRQADAVIALSCTKAHSVHITVEVIGPDGLKRSTKRLYMVSEVASATLLKDVVGALETATRCYAAVEAMP